VVKIRFQVRDEHRAGENRIGDGLGDFRFAAAGNGAGLVAEGASATVPTSRHCRPPGGFSILTL